MATEVKVRFSNGREMTKRFHHRGEADAWADQTMSMGIKVVSIVTDDEPRDSEGAPLATCSG